MIEKLPKFCRNCALRDQSQHICQLTKLAFKDEDIGCHAYCDHLSRCQICGRSYVKIDVIMDNDYICEDCLNSLGTCQLCSNAQFCDFQTNPSNLPKFIQSVRTQGNMRIQQQEKNPERIKITCAKGCKCYLNGNCIREIGNTCGNYDFRKNS